MLTIEHTELIINTNSHFKQRLHRLNSCPRERRVLSSVPQREASSVVEENFPEFGFGPDSNDLQTSGAPRALGSGCWQAQLKPCSPPEGGALTNPRLSLSPAGQRRIISRNLFPCQIPEVLFPGSRLSLCKGKGTGERVGKLPTQRTTLPACGAGNWLWEFRFLRQGLT